MFKPGQKVVFVDDSNVNPLGICPKIGEILTVHLPAAFNPGSYHIKEYPYARDGQIQMIKGFRLRPLEEVLEKVSISELIEQPIEA